MGGCNFLIKLIRVVLYEKGIYMFKVNNKSMVLILFKVSDNGDRITSFDIFMFFAVVNFEHILVC